MTMKARHNHHRNHSHYNISADVEKLKAALFDTTQDLKGRAGEMISDSVGTVRDQSLMARDSVADYAARKPFKALGIALLAGITIGFLIKR